MPILPAQLTRVLVIDDHHDGGEAVGILLEQMGCDVRVTRGGLEAIAVAPAFRPHLVITDIRMPGLSGYDTVKRLKEQAWASIAAFVVYSGIPEQLSSASGLDTQFIRYITKPGTPSDFEAVLHRVRSAEFTVDDACQGAPFDQVESRAGWLSPADRLTPEVAHWRPAPAA